MKIDFCNEVLKNQFKDKNFCQIGDKFLKTVRIGDFVETLYIIEKNKFKLTKKYYSFVEKIYMDGGYPYILESSYLYGYDTLRDALDRVNLDKKKIIQFCYNVVNELKEIGVDYWDLHSKNVMIKDNDNMKLVDLSGAISNPKQQLFYFNYAILELFLEVFLFYDMKMITNGYVPRFLKLKNISYYFSDALLKQIFAISNIEDVDFSLDIYFKEFEDGEKINELRRELKKGIN